VRRPEPVVDDLKQDRNNDSYDLAFTGLEQSIVRGTGAPTHSPVGPQLYFRNDGGVGSSIYAWNKTSWTVVV